VLFLYGEIRSSDIGQVERRTASQHIVEAASEAVDVRQVSDPFALELANSPGDLLRTHEFGRSDQATHSQVDPHHLECHAEVGYVRAPSCVEEDVRRLDVAMNEPRYVRVVQAAQNVPGNGEYIGKRQRFAGAVGYVRMNPLL
jgi:hypothetical protein